jgi:cytochrome c2
MGAAVATFCVSAVVAVTALGQEEGTGEVSGASAPAASESEWRAGDAGAGATVFKKCMACHQIGPDAKSKVGPVLTGVIGRPAGSFEGFSYGSGMIEAGKMGLVWSEDLVFDYLANPRDFLREYTGNPSAKAKMVFKLGKEEDRRNVISYLKSFDE